MLGTLALLPRLLIVLAIALACPHPVSFREGGYLPVAVIIPLLAEEPGGGLLMLGLCLLLYAIPLLLVSFVLFRRRA